MSSMGTTQAVHRTNIVVIGPAVGFKWYVDAPRNVVSFHSHRGSIEVRGWVLVNGDGAVRAAVRTQDGESAHPLNENRPDVIRHALQAPSTEHPRLKCGFSFVVPNARGGIELGFEIDGAIQWVCKLQFNADIMVQLGRCDWLFLANDTNQSAEQYTGARLLSVHELGAWRAHLDEIQKQSSRLGFDWKLLIAPAKELVFPDYYPLTRGTDMPIAQFLRAFSSHRHIVWPIDALSSSRELCYWKGDTHWTDFATEKMAAHLAQDWGLDKRPDAPRIQYHAEKRGGDLGDKMHPPQKFDVLLADTGHLDTCIDFDNCLVNHGNIRIYQRPDCDVQRSCMVFGDSFSNNLHQPLLQYFDRIVFVHTAAAVDYALIKHEQPSHVLLQTNSRFLVAPPQTHYDVSALIARKVATAGNITSQKITDMVDALSEKNRFYASLGQP